LITPTGWILKPLFTTTKNLHAYRVGPQILIEVINIILNQLIDKLADEKRKVIRAQGNDQYHRPIVPAIHHTTPVSPILEIILKDHLPNIEQSSHQLANARKAISQFQLFPINQKNITLSIILPRKYSLRTRMKKYEQMRLAQKTNMNGMPSPTPLIFQSASPHIGIPSTVMQGITHIRL
jgi:hypothetical protein